MRRLNFSVKSYVFRAGRERASFQSIVSTAKEAELMILEEFGEPKRPNCLVNFLVPHLEAEVYIEVIVHFSVVGWFMLLCQQFR
ncbi:hypothetical protein R3W88_019305 [Solanum pinnatisectum]|uniref:Uncharacterized protein n=1 Tax=Solanum pinnatisectum TaxID=50273 RepID=A0AAV9KKH9_9SOLN|nr:hypothetical protein R3W88_019305 [Solanum pinnatisectum]